MAMTLRQLILGKIAEEAAEIAQVALKAQQFGLDDIHPVKQITNLSHLKIELVDLQAVVGMLVDDLKEEGTVFDTSGNTASLNAKVQKVAKWARYMQSKGKLHLPDEDVPAWFAPYWNTP